MTERTTTDRPFTSVSFQAYMNEGKLMGSRNRETGEVFVPPRPIDPTTHGADMEWVELSGRGKLAAFTSVYIGTTAMIDAGFDRKTPYVAGIVELEEGPRLSAQLLGVDGKQPDIAWIGRSVRASFIERGEGDKRRAFLAFETEE
ncbi:MAG: Zn-ribbon domain-containing OB-fold protein [Candidatus Promineofilum sp.]|nr:Zn-ribbon domain-containing OB-fold protein [Promineifilum sp.]